MPGEDRGRLDDDETGPRVCPEAGEPDSEDPVPTGEPGSADGSPKDHQLVAKRKVLERDGRWLEEQGTEEGPEPNHEEHRGTPAPGMASEPRLLPDRWWGW